jgi:hypothetical protein
MSTTRIKAGKLMYGKGISRGSSLHSRNSNERIGKVCDSSGE